MSDYSACFQVQSVSSRFGLCRQDGAHYKDKTAGSGAQSPCLSFVFEEIVPAANNVMTPALCLLRHEIYVIRASYSFPYLRGSEKAFLIKR